ncbi:MAG: DUF4286 family protein [Chitinophagaceae bacterium]|nr:MAG: DUF4286 family protein [Chitinophagaceae bacterium]
MAETAIIYNITYKVPQEVKEEWFTWMRTKHVPNILATRCFYKAKFLKVKEDDSNSLDTDITYAVQYHATNFANYERYIQDHQDKFRADTHTRWGNQILSFRTILEVVD